MFFLYAGSLLIYIPVYGINYVNSAILIHILIGSFYTKYYNYILPNSILEISGTIIASASAFVIMFYVYEMIRLGKKFSEKFTIRSETIRLIVMGVVISFINFLAAWPLEVAIIQSTIHNSFLPALWFRYAYFLDISIIASDIISFFILFKGKYISPATLYILFLPSTVLAFILDINPLKINLNFYPQFIWGVITIFSFLLIINYFRDIFLKNRNEDQNTSLKIISGSGTSMVPSIKSHDLVIIDMKSNTNISNGDIITFKANAVYYPLAISGLITHRVIYTEDKYIKTKGDNVSKPDLPIDKFQVVGKVVAIIHRENKNKFICESLIPEKSEEINDFFMLNQLKNTDPFPYQIRVLIFMFLAILINLFIFFI